MVDSVAYEAPLCLSSVLAPESTFTVTSVNEPSRAPHTKALAPFCAAAVASDFVRCRAPPSRRSIAERRRRVQLRWIRRIVHPSSPAAS